jgi:hypothetical protein
METLQRTANRGSISTGYDIDNSLKLEADNSEKLSRSQTTGTNRKKFTVSFWVKRSELGALQVLASAEVSGNDISFLDFESDDFLRFRDTASASDQCILQTNRVFRDTSAWYHIVLRVDTTDGTADDRNRIYVNGVQETSFSARTNFDLNDDTFWGYNGGNLTWGNALGEANYYSGYTAEAVYVDGLSLAPTSFGEFDEDTGIWKPIDVSSLTFGNNGYYLDFEDSSNLGNDASGGTDFTLNNITSADQATDTPTNNFATTNPIPRYFTETFTTEGATVVTKNANGWIAPQSTICPASGKWYMEFKFNAVDSRIVGAAPIGGTLWDSATHYGGTVGSNSVGYADTGYLYVNDSGVNPTYGPAYDNSNIIAVALDMNNGYIYWAKDNTWINTADPVAGSGGYALPAGLVEHSIGASVYQQAKQSFANFGGYTTISISSAASDANGYGTFEYAPPSGYYALCTKNLAEFG